MRRSSRGGVGLLLVAATLAPACYESDFPLDPSPRIEIDAALLGTWRCLPSLDPRDDDQAGTLVVARGGDNKYAATFQDTGGDTQRYEAFASALSGVSLLNVRELTAPGAPVKPWVFLRYAFLRPKVLQIQIVDKEALKDVDPSPASVRAALARKRKAPGTYADLMVCVRARS